jgi:hypothetical protein
MPRDGTPYTVHTLLLLLLSLSPGDDLGPWATFMGGPATVRGATYRRS